MIIKAISKDVRGSCENCGKDAKWKVAFDVIGETKLCRPCYRTITAWECPSCEHTLYGMANRCTFCGTLRRNTCRKCGFEDSTNLVKITKKREGHPCHECFGRGMIKTDARCIQCEGVGTSGMSVCMNCEGVDEFIVNGKVVVCPVCDGAKYGKLTCSACGGSGSKVGREQLGCTSCQGTGVCRSSSAHWEISRVAINDLPEEFQKDAEQWVDQLICFSCANPDIVRGETTLGSTLTRTKSINTPNGWVRGLKYMTDDERLEALKKKADDLTGPNPQAVVTAKLDRAIAAVEHRMASAAQRAWRRYEGWERLKLKADGLREHDPVERLQLDILKRRMGDAEVRLAEDKDVRDRNVALLGTLREIRERLLADAAYSLWDPKSDPRYEGKPDIRHCKRCDHPFNARKSWYCNNCIEFTEVAVGDTRRPDYSHDQVVMVAHGTDNRIPEDPDEFRGTCESCKKIVNTLYRHMLKIDRKVVGNTFTCKECSYRPFDWKAEHTDRIYAELERKAEVAGELDAAFARAAKVAHEPSSEEKKAADKKAQEERIWKLTLESLGIEKEPEIRPSWRKLEELRTNKPLNFVIPETNVIDTTDKPKHKIYPLLLKDVDHADERRKEAQYWHKLGEATKIARVMDRYTHYRSWRRNSALERSQNKLPQLTMLEALRIFFGNDGNGGLWKKYQDQLASNKGNTAPK